MKLIFRLFRVVAVLLAVYASCEAFFVSIFRFDTVSEFEMVKQYDFQVGGMLALAIVLFFVPGRTEKRLQCLMIFSAAVMSWLAASSILVAHHEWVDRIRSGR